MPDVLTKCPTCGAILDEEDLFCPNCGRESPRAEQTSGPPASHETTCNFVCKACGASMSYDPKAGALRCPFCGSTQLDKQPDAKEIAPKSVVPFVVTKESAVAGMRKWLGSSMWRPGDLSEQAAVVAMTGVYVPYWVFQANTHTFWTADSSKVPFGARGKWCPLTGRHEGEYSGLLVGASGALTPAETTALCPFDLSVAVPPDKVDLNNAIFERFTVPRKYARPLANQGFESLEGKACGQYVPGTCRNLKVNVRITDMSSEPMLAPVWIMAYRYKARVFRFLVNGQSGRATGSAPLSWRRISIAIAVAVILLAILLLALFGHARGPRMMMSEPAAGIQSVARNDSFEAMVFGRIEGWKRHEPTTASWSQRAGEAGSQPRLNEEWRLSARSLESSSGHWDQACPTRRDLPPSEKYSFHWRCQSAHSCLPDMPNSANA